MNSVIVRRQKKRLSPPQPLDRHLSEIGEFDGTIYINAGIDSTCCKKPIGTIHKLTDGIMVSTSSPMVTSTTKSRNLSGDNDDLSPVLSNSSRHYNDRFDSINNSCCAHCGK